MQTQKTTQEKELEESEGDILKQKEELKSSQQVLDEKTKIVDAAKKTALKVSKVLDQALKEIATWVSETLSLDMSSEASSERRN